MSTSFPMEGKRVRFSGETHVGMRRDHNEDSFFLPHEEKLAIVADGMGGHAAGEVASQMAVNTVVDYFQATRYTQPLTWPFKVDRGTSLDVNRMVVAIKHANQSIWETSAHADEAHGMGTTIVAALFQSDYLIIGHVGDSRLYRIRDGSIEQITQDHSLLNDYIQMKHMTEAEIEAFPHKNVIVRALGMKASVEVDILEDKPRIGDLYILCSDGLSGMLTDEQIAALALEEHDLDVLCERLIAAANAHGGHDNITVVCARIEPL